MIRGFRFSPDVVGGQGGTAPDNGDGQDGNVPENEVGQGDPGDPEISEGGSTDESTELDAESAKAEREALIEELEEEGLTPDQIRSHLRDVKAAQRKISAQGLELSSYRKKLDDMTARYQQTAPASPPSNDVAPPTQDELDEIAENPAAWAAKVRNQAIQSAREAAISVSKETNVEMTRFNADITAIDEMTTEYVFGNMGDAFDEDVAEEAEKLYNSDPFYVNAIASITPAHLKGGAHAAAEFMAQMKRRAYGEALLNRQASMKRDGELSAKRKARSEALLKSGASGIRPGAAGKPGASRSGKSEGIDNFLAGVKSRKY